MSARSHEELRQLVAPYVLGAVTGEEAALVRDHLVSCEECLAEADGYSTAASSLALAVPPEPLPRGFADRVLARVAEERPSAAEADRRASPRSRWRLGRVLAYASAALVVGALALGLVDARRDEARARDLVEALVAGEGMELSGDGAAGRVVPTERGGLFVVAGLDPAPDGRDYQLWVMEDCGGEPCAPESAGTFDASDEPVVVEINRPVEDVVAAAVTLERDGGAAAPTTDPVVTSG